MKLIGTAIFRIAQEVIRKPSGRRNPHGNCHGFKHANQVFGWPFAAIALLFAQQPLWAESPSSVQEGTSLYTAADDPSGTGSEVDSLLDLDIEQLGNVDVVTPAFDVEVTSVTRNESTVGKSPAAVFVITQEMIRRNGATSIPEALRMAPGIQVAKIDANKWTVSSRGFNGFTSNKTLVMIDGRKVVTPLFDGTLFGSVNWDAQDLVLQDIDRIEVVRGPGGTLWGANAVNGVINIITKKSSETQGWLYSGGGGSEDKAINALRYGGSHGDDFHYRVYVKHFERDKGSNDRTNGRHGVLFDEGANDDWRQQRIGFRTDWDVDGCGTDTLTFQGDYYDGASGFSQEFREQTTPHEKFNIYSDTNISGGNLLGRWEHKTDEDSGWTLQAYYDYIRRDSEVLRSRIDVFDIDLTHRARLNDRHNLTWGARFRHYSDSMQFPNPSYSYIPASRDTNLASLFFQDQISLIEDQLDLWIGSKFEHNDFTGFEYQPSVRMLWTVDPKRVVWGAISRAIRTPSRTEDDLLVLLGSHNHSGITAFESFIGNSDLEAEDVISFELGYRAQPRDEFSWDVAAFYNEYRDNIAFIRQPDLWAGPSTVFIRDVFDNNLAGVAYGAEVSGTFDLTETWRLIASYSYVQIVLDAEPNADTSLIYEEGITPHSQVYAQSSWDLPCHLEFDLSGRFVDRLPLAEVKGYLELNARLGYRPNENWEFSIVGQNLLNPTHREFEQVLVRSNRVDRGVYAQVVWTR